MDEFFDHWNTAVFTSPGIDASSCVYRRYLPKSGGHWYLLEKFKENLYKADSIWESKIADGELQKK